MNMKLINTVIPIASLVIFFIWGWIEGSNAHSWIIFLIAGGLMSVLNTMGKGKEETGKDEKNKEEKGKEE